MNLENAFVPRVIVEGDLIAGPFCSLAKRPRDQLKFDVIQADAMMLLEFARSRVIDGNMRPISTREALEAVHRKQGDTLNAHDAAHLREVAAMLSGMFRDVNPES